MTPESSVQKAGGRRRLTGDLRIYSSDVPGLKGLTVHIKEGELIVPQGFTIDTQRLTQKQKQMPAGVLQSMLPIVREALSRGEEIDSSDDSYWELVDENAPFGPGKACRKMKRVGFSAEETAVVIVSTQSRVRQEIAHGRLGEKALDGLVSSVAQVVKDYYNGTRVDLD